MLVDPFGLEESLHDRLQQAKVEVLALQKENPQKAQIYADLIRRIEQILALDQQRALAGAQLALLERLIQIGERIEQINNEITGGPDGPEKALVPIILQRAAPKATPKGWLAELLVLNIAFACESYKELARVRALVAEGEALLAETLELQAALDAIAKDITITDVGPKGPKRTKRQRECDEKYLADVATCSATYTGRLFGLLCG